MRTFALFDAFMECPHGQGGREIEPVRTFCGQGGRRSIFRDFVRTSFMDGSLALSLIALFTNLVVKSLQTCQSKMTRMAVTTTLAFL